MDHHRFAALARTFAPSRRSALAILLAAGSGLAGRTPGAARKKKHGPDCGKLARQRCSADAARCRSLYLPSCQLEPAECEAAAACCDSCAADGLLLCLLELQSTMEARLA